jgi:hypothetical protein
LVAWGARPIQAELRSARQQLSWAGSEVRALRRALALRTQVWAGPGMHHQCTFMRKNRDWESVTEIPLRFNAFLLRC